MPSLEPSRFNPNYVLTEQDKIDNARREHYERMNAKFDVYEQTLWNIVALYTVNDYSDISHADIEMIVRTALSEGE